MSTRDESTPKKRMPEKSTLESITIRPLIKMDEALLWTMLYLAIYVPPGETPPPVKVVFEPGLAKYVRGWGRDGDCGFVASDGQYAAGAAWLRLLAGEERGYGWVNDQTPELSIAVIPKVRGKGLGTQLLNKTLALADERYPAVSLSVSVGNPAVHLYRRLGFEEVKQTGASLTMVRKSR